MDLHQYLANINTDVYEAIYTFMVEADADYRVFSKQDMREYVLNALLKDASIWTESFVRAEAQDAFEKAWRRMTYCYRRSLNTPQEGAIDSTTNLSREGKGWRVDYIGHPKVSSKHTLGW